MHYPRTLASLLGLMALSAAALFLPAPARAQTFYTVTDLNPAGVDGSVANAVSGNTQVGSVGHTPSNGYTDAALWTGSAASFVDLNPPGFDASEGLGASGDTQVGDAFNFDTFYPHAFLWHGTAASGVDLTPAGFNQSRAYAAFGNTQVGDANEQAFLWHGTAASAVSLNPKGSASYAYGVSGDTQVGMAYLGGHYHAVLWHGTAASVVDLNPAGFDGSEALGTDGTSQVGDAYTVNSMGEELTQHAMLWTGTADSAVALQSAGFVGSEATAVSGNTQVGYEYTVETEGSTNIAVDHAVVWHGTAASVVDLNQFLPAGFRGTSQALGVLPNGDIVGYGSPGFGTAHAFIWHPATAPATPAITDLNPGSRTQGRAGFTLTVTGTGFTSKSEVQWNGQAQPTTFVSGTTLTAQIPASLIADVGTAKVTVYTPGAGRSNARTEVIMPRPVITGIYPTSKKAGSEDFALAVTGANFRPASFYAPTIVKWNGATLTSTYVSPTQLTAQVPASLVAHSGTATVTVTTPQVATAAGKAFIITP